MAALRRPACARDVGAIVHVETMVDIARKKAARRQRETDRREFLASDRGVRAAGAEVQRLFTEIERQAAELTEAVPEFDLRAKREQRMQMLYKTGCIIEAPRHRLVVWWTQPMARSLNDAQLEVALLRGGIAQHSKSSLDVWTHYHFSLTPDGEQGWEWHEDVDYGAGRGLMRVRDPEVEPPCAKAICFTL